MAEDTGKRLIQEAMASMNAKNQRKRDEELEAIVRKLLELESVLIGKALEKSEKTIEVYA